MTKLQFKRQTQIRYICIRTFILLGFFRRNCPNPSNFINISYALFFKIRDEIVKTIQ